MCPVPVEVVFRAVLGFVYYIAPMISALWMCESCVASIEVDREVFIQWNLSIMDPISSAKITMERCIEM